MANIVISKNIEGFHFNDIDVFKIAIDLGGEKLVSPYNDFLKMIYNTCDQSIKSFLVKNDLHQEIQLFYAGLSDNKNVMLEVVGDNVRKIIEVVHK